MQTRRIISQWFQKLDNLKILLQTNLVPGEVLLSHGCLSSLRWWTVPWIFEGSREKSNSMT